MIGIRDIPYDETLPQLSKALDVSLMLEKFQATMFESEQFSHRFRVTDCEVVYVKYKPQKPCTVCYQVVIRDISTNQVHTQLHSARIFESGGSTPRYTNAQHLPLIPPYCGKALIHIPEFEMVIWSFPNDRKLRALPQLTNPVLLEEQLLPELIVQLFGQGWTIIRATTEVMNYVPRYSCTVKVMFQMRSQELAEKKSLIVYGKTYVDQKSGENAYAVMHELWETDARKSGEFRMAQPAWYDLTHNIFWQFAVSGTTLLQYDMKNPHFTTLLEKAGASIAILHTLPVTKAHPIRVEDLIARLQQTNIALSYLKPHVIQRLQAIVTLLMAQTDEIGDQPETTLHGDLHLKNFIVDGTSVTMIDLDEVGRGSPFHDVGSCIAFILYQGLEIGLPEPWIEELVGGFLQGYRRKITWNVPEPVLRWHVVAALIDERVTRCLKKAKPGTVQQVERLLELAFRLASGDQKIPIENSLSCVKKHPSPNTTLRSRA